MLAWQADKQDWQSGQDAKTHEVRREITDLDRQRENHRAKQPERH